jgi:hypothetical protein
MKRVLCNNNSAFKSIIRIALCIVLMYFAACQPETESEKKSGNATNLEKELNVAYNSYKLAVSNSNGAEAASLVSGNTIRYYSSLLDLVQSADSSKLLMTGLLEKFTVLAIRQTVDWGRLRAMDGKELFIYAIENGQIGKDVANTSVGKVEQKNDNLAHGELLMGGKPTKRGTNFYREDGRWRVDLVEILKENEKSLKKMMEQPNMSESQCIVLFFKQVFGHEPSREMWLPVKWYNTQ